MNVFYDYKKIAKLNNKNLSITIGNFDGVHLGHQALVRQLQRMSQGQGHTMVIVFEPQPKEFFLGEQAPRRIFSVEEKIHALKKLGVDHVLVLRFDHEMINMSANEFIEEILIKNLEVKNILIGDDFKFGKNRQGDFSLLENYANQGYFSLERYDTYYLYEKRVSSTWIRECLSSGNLPLASTLLGTAHVVPLI